MNNRAKRRRGFSMVDVIVGICVLSVTLAIAVCTFASAMTASDSQRCHDNMEIVGNLEAKYRVTNSAHAYTTSTAALATTAPAMPICPDGGTYTITISTGTAVAENGQTVPAGKLVISCSNSAHGKYAPDIDAP